MDRALWRRRELYYTVGREGWASEGSPLCRCESLFGNKWEEVLRLIRVIDAGYSFNIKAKVVLFEGFPEGAVFGAPLHQVFFHPCFVAAVADAPWFATGQDTLYGGFVPWGVTAS